MSMKSNKKRRRNDGRPSIHPNNKYSENPPDFALLASLYPSFEPFVFYSGDGCPRIDWTDFNATRELTRVLLLHDHGVNWWIPDGQLCPTVPNRSNYIHWIEDLLLSNIIPKAYATGDNVKGFDIGTGANCIYPLIGASLLGWSFVGSDVTDVALEWAEKNVKGNPHISELIEIRRVENPEDRPSREGSQNFNLTETYSSTSQHADANERYCGPPILLGVVKDGEKFDFCMCNPPFFGTMEEAGLNPKTSCGGTPEEMVCYGGEKVFITRIIEDSFILKHTFRWYTTMVGRKANLKYLTSKLWKGGVTIVKITEFVQGQTHRWGIAWSFVAPANMITHLPVAKKNNFSFMLEGIQRQFSAIHVLQFVESLLSNSGASCNLNTSLFTIDVTASRDHCNGILKNNLQNLGGAPSVEDVHDVSTNTSCLNQHKIDLCFRILVFQQIPGTLLVKGSLKQGDTQVSGVFSLIMQKLEQSLKHNFCRGKAS